MIYWPDLKFPPINLWSLPRIMTEKKLCGYELEENEARALRQIVNNNLGFHFPKTYYRGMVFSTTDLQTFLTDYFQMPSKRSSLFIKPLSSTK